MRVLLVLILIVSCVQREPIDQLFLTPDQSSLLDIDEYGLIDDFDSVYCIHFDSSKSEPLRIPFDFDTYKFSKLSNKSLSVFGHPMRCSEISCCSYRTEIRIDETGRWVNLYGEYLLNTDIDSVMHATLFNYGLDPSLTDKPEDAIFVIRFTSGSNIADGSELFGSLSSSYANIIAEQIEFMSYQKAIDSIPFNLILGTFIKSAPIPIDTVYQEIEDAIELDLQDVGGI